MAGNAARCALELAVLDAYGRRFGRPLGDAVRLADVPGLCGSARGRRGSGTAGRSRPSSSRQRAVSAWKIWLYGFAPGQAQGRRRRPGRPGPAARPAQDPRASGSTCGSTPTRRGRASEVVERVRPLLPFRPSVLEQPVKHAEVDALAELRPRLGMPVMLDESLCGYPDAVRSIERGTADLFNVRLSKCGGIIPSLRIIGLAQRSGVGVQLGCHPGETALLSAAGRHVASNVRGLRYVEGSYDSHILAGEPDGRRPDVRLRRLGARA